MKFEFNRKEKLAEVSKTITTSLRLLGLFWQSDRVLFLLFFFSRGVFSALFPFANAYIYKLIIDQIVQSVQSGNLDLSQIYWLLAARIISFVMQSLSYSIEEYASNAVWTKFAMTIHQLVLGRISHLDLAIFEDSKFKDQLEKVEDSYAWRPMEMISALFSMLRNVIQVGAAFVAIMLFNPILALVVLLIAVPIFLVEAKFAKVSFAIWDNNSPHRKKFWYIGWLLQHAPSVKELKLFKTGEWFLKEMKVIQDKFVGDNMKLLKQQMVARYGVDLIGTTVYVLIEISIFLSALRRQISIGDIAYYLTVVENFKTGIEGLIRQFSHVFRNSLFVQEVFSVIDRQSFLSESSHPVKLELDKAPKIEFRNVSFHYPGTEKKIFDHFSFVIRPGEKVAFVGENGAGKTTMVKLLARFYDVTAGEILINDVNVKDLDLNDWYEHLGVLFQDFIRYEYPLKDNISLGRVGTDSEMEKIVEAAKMAGADEVATTLDHGYEQMLGKTFDGGVELSAGQWQKVALGRAFLRNAPVLILDEPTASIDAKAESEIFARVEKLSKDKTVIIISHRFSTVRNADKIYVVNEGKIIESGTHQTLIKQAGTYATLFNLQAEGYK